MRRTYLHARRCGGCCAGMLIIIINKGQHKENKPEIWPKRAWHALRTHGLPLSFNDHTNTRHETLYEITIEGLVHNLHTILSKTCSVIMLPSSGGPGLCLVLSLLLVLIIVHSHAINLSYTKHLAVANIQITPLINLYTFNPLWGGCNIKCFQLRAALLR